ncbi:MAG TPA: UbiA family prenyltransferase [Candidatus Eremiobacteraceae bacterium]|nr:UbiA family prenyltransferase [Candidatus Eremiobacteraceae bacterium]
MLKRLWIYQRERFPLLTHGVVIAAFSASAIAYSAWARHAQLPAWWILAAGFLSSLIFFAQMRVADEWKDAADDAKFRPYRPVPRGLVTLRELASVAIGGGLVQLAIALLIAPRLLPMLIAVWAYFALMSREFFVGRWLRLHPAAYIASHMIIVPMIDFYISSFDWLVAHAAAPHALLWFLAVTYCNGIAVEIGRKIRSPQDEERGVETYTSLWGGATATTVWCAAILITVILGIAAASIVGFDRYDTPIFGVALASAIGVAGLFLLRPTRAASRIIEAFSGTWTVVLYTSLGLLPFVIGAAS